MKMQLSLRHLFALVAGTAFAVVGLSCKQGPIDYSKFEERTVEANLGSIDSASTVYAAQLAAGQTDSAAAQAACQLLMTQPGVDTVQIAPDHEVWAFFTSGLLAGTGRPWHDSASSSSLVPGSSSGVRIASGGEVYDTANYVIPFSTDLPGSQSAVDAVSSIFLRSLNWKNKNVLKDAQVDLSAALNLFKDCRSVLFWDGHGDLCMPQYDKHTAVPGLILGKKYTRESAAMLAVSKYAGYLNPGPGQDRQVSVEEYAGERDFSFVILPAFISAHANFDADEGTQGDNFCKTVVVLDDCYSAWSDGAGTGPLVQAFLGAGADVVCGFTWEASERFGWISDTTFLSKMADTNCAYQAFDAVANKTDYGPIDGKTAEFKMYGDSSVMLRCMFQACKDGVLYAACQGGDVYQSGGVTSLGDWLHTQGDWTPTEQVSVSFPGTGPGTYDCGTANNASITWFASDGNAYLAMKGFHGVSGTIQIDKCDGGNVYGSFSGTLGWWNNNQDPSKDPPAQTITVTNGKVKHTGKTGNGTAGPQPAWSGPLVHKS